MINDAEIALLVKETGWTLEYIREQPISSLRSLLSEISYRRVVETYQGSYNSALIVCALVNSEKRHYKPEDIIGHKPERRDMPEDKLEQTPQPDTVRTSSGKTYTLHPLTINIMCELQQRVGKAEMAELASGKPNFDVVRMMYYLRAKKNHPEITEDEAGEIIASSIITKQAEAEAKEIIASSIKQV